MKNHTFGNGSGKTEVNVYERAADWVYLAPKKPEPYPEDLPIGLGEVLLMWATAQGNIRIRATLPIIKDGNLIGIHVWYDRVAEHPSSNP